MTYVRDRGLCLTCGGPAAVCAAADRCAGLGRGLVPPPVTDDRFTRAEPTVTSFGWRVKVALTAGMWGFGLLAGSRFTTTGRPMLVFLGVPYVVAAAALTRQVWRPHRVSGRAVR